MENNNETGYAILGWAFCIVVVLECICGALEVFGVSTGNFGGIVALFIPLLIISFVALWALGKLTNRDLFSTPWILLGTVAFLWLSIIIQIL